jgi:hypothetical protein
VKINTIKISDSDLTIKWTTPNGTEFTVKSDKTFPGSFGAAVAGLAKVAAAVLTHDAELLCVRSIVVSENKKGIEFVKLAGLLAGVSKDGAVKPGKFVTPKIEITLFAREAMKLMTDEARGYAKGCAE